LWKSRCHNSITLSTTETGYLAATETRRDVLYVKSLLDGDNLNANDYANVSHILAKRSETF